MPRGRPTKDISRKDFEGLLSIGADQGENENFETLKAQIGTPMLKMKVRQGLIKVVAA